MCVTEGGCSAARVTRTGSVTYFCMSCKTPYVRWNWWKSLIQIFLSSCLWASCLREPCLCCCGKWKLFPAVKQGGCWSDKSLFMLPLFPEPSQSVVDPIACQQPLLQVLSSARMAAKQLPLQLLSSENSVYLWLTGAWFGTRHTQ